MTPDFERIEVSDVGPPEGFGERAGPQGQAEHHGESADSVHGLPGLTVGPPHPSDLKPHVLRAAMGDVGDQERCDAEEQPKPIRPAKTSALNRAPISSHMMTAVGIFFGTPMP